MSDRFRRTKVSSMATKRGISRLNPRSFIVNRFPGWSALCHYIRWSLIAIVCLCGLMYQSLKSFEAFFEYPYEVVVYDSRGSNKLLFPSVTVCPDIWVDSQVTLTSLSNLRRMF